MKISSVWYDRYGTDRSHGDPECRAPDSSRQRAAIDLDDRCHNADHDRSRRHVAASEAGDRRARIAACAYGHSLGFIDAGPECARPTELDEDLVRESQPSTLTRTFSKIPRRAAPQASGSRPQKKTVRTITILDGLFSVVSCGL
jgi:hypothetical protein